MIQKHILSITSVQSIQTPSGSIALSAQYQNGDLCLWVNTRDLSGGGYKRIEIYGTGDSVPGGRKHISTAQSPEGLVWHVFEVI